MPSSEIRREARQLLKNLVGKYKLFLFPILASLFASGLYAKVTINQQLAELQETVNTVQTSANVSYNLFSQLLSFIITVLSVSAAYTVLEAYRQKRAEASYKDSLRGFASPYLFKLFLVYLSEVLLILPWILLMFSPLVAVYVLILINTNTGTPVSIDFMGLAMIPFFVGLVMAIIKSYAYSQANLILFDRIEEGGDTNPFDIIKESVQLMKGKKFDFFILRLSFLGWVILIPLTLGLAAIYVLPYIVAADTVFYDNLKNPKDA